MTNTGNNINTSGQNPDALLNVEAERESALSRVLQSSRTKYLALFWALPAMISGAAMAQEKATTAEVLAALNAEMPQVSTPVAGQEIRVAAVDIENNPVVAIPEGDETVVDSMEWLGNIDRENPTVLLYVSGRMTEWNYPFYSDFLENTFAALSHEEQAALAAYTLGTGGWSVEENPDYESMMPNGRVPEPLIAHILEKAVEAGADPDPDWGDIPAFEEALLQLRDTGDTDAETLRAIIEFVPEEAALIPDVALYMEILQSLAESEASLAESTAARIASEIELAQSREGLANLQATLDSLADTIRKGEEMLERWEEALDVISSL